MNSTVVADVVVVAPKKKHRQHLPQDIIDIFDSLFSESENTRLICGGNEPLYLPAKGLYKNKQTNYHQVIFAHGFYASALHEIAHWLVAGPQRRLQEDYGYWYCPDGRTVQQQAEFEKVEIYPQALEAILAHAAGFRFRISADNLSGKPVDRPAFAQKVHQRACDKLQQGLSPRMQLLVDHLQDFYQTSECFPQNLKNANMADW
ncbi:elongation factor P hydroxylase [Pelagibaculum spongiae]|uniref:Elongation factor P hydroxylase n=1 Tax=Pelagibaculum spongiae TaxID=2080658 RepID=A0A2V1GXV5_9GAMM|nr:elongation factor P hydroxylase [Pelagibaculum spongiae]PVZ69485.1 hypothetical protein DC094_09140 [Pelagibaculum spongiae]